MEVRPSPTCAQTGYSDAVGRGRRDRNVVRHSALIYEATIFRGGGFAGGKGPRRSYAARENTASVARRTPPAFTAPRLSLSEELSCRTFPGRIPPRRWRAKVAQVESFSGHIWGRKKRWESRKQEPDRPLVEKSDKIYQATRSKKKKKRSLPGGFRARSVA